MKSVLSVQSHVVHGYVGNKAAVFPLQTQGWDVDNINTVNFSNHTGYGSFKGTVSNLEDLNPVLNHLNDVLDIKYDAIITGYIPNSDIIKIVKNSVIKFKAKNSKILYLFDPVMGDNDYLYVDKSCISEYLLLLQEKIVDIITPNQFELELLCKFKIDSKTALQKAIRYLHQEFNIKYVVITSLNSNLFEENESNNIYCTISHQDHSDMKVFKIPTIESYFTGVGDLFSALLLDKLFNQNGVAEDALTRFELAVNQVLTIMSDTLNLTLELALQKLNENSKETIKTISGQINDLDTMKHLELRIIQSAKFYDYKGPGKFNAESLTCIDNKK